jgi:predicted HAD superfamily Cof-like phosphohydrolase
MNNQEVTSETVNRTPFQQVHEFQEVFNHPINTEPQYELFRNDKALVALRISLINEEIHELWEAFNEKDMIEIVDALADILYVVCGAFHVFGIDCDVYSKEYLPFSEHMYNEDKQSRLTFKRNFFEEDENVERLRTAIDTMNQLLVNLKLNSSVALNSFSSDLYKDTESIPCEQSTEDLKLNRNKRTVAINNHKTLMIMFNFENFINTLMDIYNQCFTISSLIMVDIKKCFDEVHRSNMTKVCSTEENAQQSVESYIKDERYPSPDYKKSTNPKYWMVYEKSTLKTLKSIDFKTPCLSKIIYEEVP